jgi:hypothetical protein
MCLEVDLIRGLSVIVAEMTRAELKPRFTILACRQHSRHRRAIARFGHYSFAEVILIWGQEKVVNPVPSSQRVVLAEVPLIALPSE